MSLFDKLKKRLMLKSDLQKNKDPSSSNINGEIPVYSRQTSIEESNSLKQPALLTQREYSLFLLLVEGFTLKESAQQLSINYSTANNHMVSIYKKLNVSSRAELIINYRYFRVETKKEI